MGKIQNYNDNDKENQHDDYDNENDNYDSNQYDDLENKYDYYDQQLQQNEFNENVDNKKFKLNLKIFDGFKNKPQQQKDEENETSKAICGKLYPGQVDAIITSFKRSLQLILGPPGCGKSKVGTTLLLNILNYFKEKMPWQRKPIIIMSQSNSALDNFLEQILNQNEQNDNDQEKKQDELKMIRIGGQSKSQKLYKYNLNYMIDEFNSEKEDNLDDIYFNEHQDKEYNDNIKYKKEIMSEQNSLIKQLKQQFKCFQPTCVPNFNDYKILEVFQKFDFKNQFIKSIRSFFNSEIDQDSDLLKIFYKKFYINVDLNYENYDEFDFQNDNLKNDKNIQNIKDKFQLDGITVAGGSKYNEILEIVKPKVVIVEEAAQILEGQLLASLPYTIEHLVLIGDHFQQTRMRPEISKYVRLFYEKGMYQDHESTQNLEPIKGVKESVFFWNVEDSTEEIVNRSYSNEKEAQLVLNLARYLLLQGYDPKDITILSMYQGQLSYIKKLIDHGNPNYLYNKVDTNLFQSEFQFQNKNDECEWDYQEDSDNSDQQNTVLQQNQWDNIQNNDENEKKRPSRFKKDTKLQYQKQKPEFKKMLREKSFKYFNKLKEIDINTVDKFQGQENKIIILTLVRSNEDSKIGFLIDQRRINVSLSRAKNGLFVFGNFKLMNESCRDSEMDGNKWNELISLAENGGQFGDFFTTQCQKHGKQNNIYNADDFKKLIYGGCTNHTCKQIREDCQHICYELCHSIEHSEIPCNEQLEHICKDCGDSQKIYCFQKDTYKCQNQIEIVIQPCNHKNKIVCFERNENKECELQCEKILKCGHKCEKLCKETCSEKDCIQNVQIQLPCGHVKQDVPCNLSQKSKFEFECKEKCDKKLECGHLCQGDCHTCFQGTLHNPCKESKSEISPICGHKIEYNCSMLKPVCMKQFNKKVSKQMLQIL
ncbi:P-loop containing nucleoside triphosphate hydrolase [Pseudocohnilembus persalinus]|uniref:p-loop containing nucleoside triphosphate hydrolase n=1 Tax=Pseudocohnilembus persalinus TaxID=266149 RepID=A0A0V0QFU4_PSEPJ|nr:P-loop containing nucleoside triphosphate hydrolase [Pseudocohnilembus persalinus]|eukprot:KRX01013.1 P-loop containing nucleoside triphosphate hydrolase [Pseudocohnilembus persalinus]